MTGIIIVGILALVVAVYIICRSHINNKNAVKEHVTEMANLLHDRIAGLEAKVNDKTTELHGKIDTVVENTKSLVQSNIDDEDNQIRNMLAKIKSLGGSVLETLKNTKTDVETCEKEICCGDGSCKK